MVNIPIINKIRTVFFVLAGIISIGVLMNVAHAQPTTDKITKSWEFFGGPLVGIDITQVRQNIFSLVIDFARPIPLIDHGNEGNLRAPSIFQFLTRGHLATVQDALRVSHVLLTDRQASSIGLCRSYGDALKNGITIPSDAWQKGIASWYGPGFHGRTTASGEEYDKHGISAAHKTLPLGSIVRVVRPANGAMIIVEITDRGPYIAGRIIDLSLGAKQELDMGDITQVFIERINPSTLTRDTCQ